MYNRGTGHIGERRGEHSNLSEFCCGTRLRRKDARKGQKKCEEQLVLEPTEVEEVESAI
jgi:hypothetical protein